MPIGRIALDFWSHPKRGKLERLTKGRWAPRPPLAMSAGEACARILAWLDGQDCTSGEIEDAEDMASVAGWAHDPTDLMAALITSGLVDEGPPPSWHNFARLNGSAIRQRNYRRNASRNEPHNEIRGSGSGSSSDSDTGPSVTKAEVERKRISRFTSLWNKATTGRNVGRLVRDPPRGTVRANEILRFIDDCGGKINLAAASIDAALGQEWLDRADDKLRVDWFLRKQNREKHIEMGMEILNGMPK